MSCLGVKLPLRSLFGVVKVVFLLAVVLVADLGRPAVILARVDTLGSRSPPTVTSEQDFL